MGKWMRRHGYAIGACIHMLRTHSVGAILTIIGLGLVFALPFALGMLLMNARTDAASLPPALTISVYLKPDVSEQAARELAQTARARKDIASVTVIGATQALQEFRARSGLGSALDALGNNPLPTVLAITPAASASSPPALDALREQLSSWPQADSVQLDRDWARRLDALRSLLLDLLRVSAVLLALTVVAIVGNTSRLEILERHEEIELGRLLGGNGGFLRRPFLYLGATYGVAGAFIAWGSVALAGKRLAASLAALGSAYGTRLTLHAPTLRDLGVLFGAGLILGWLGAAIAAARQVAQATPRPR